MSTTAVENIVKKAMPGVRIVKTVKTESTRGTDLKRGVHKAPKLDVMQRKVIRKRGLTGAKAKIASPKATTKGPSGIVYVTPKNADALGSRAKAKAVVVSRGKIIALQG